MLKLLRTVPFYAPAYGHGGPVVHTENLSKIQANNGFDVRIFTANIYSDERLNVLPKYEVVNKVKIHRFPVKLRFGNSHYFITPNILKGFIKYDFDLIHSHSLRTFQTNIATLFSYLKKKPFIFTAHGTLRNMYLLNLFLTKKKEADRMKLFDHFFKNFFLNSVDRVIVHSQHEKYWTLKYNVPEEKIRVIPHGVNLAIFNNGNYKKLFKKKYNIKDNEKIIVYVGRLFRNYRNLVGLINAMKEIVREQKTARLFLIGHSFDRDYEIELKKNVQDLNLNQNIIFVTNPTRSEIIGAYQSSNLVVFPITESDGFGIPLLEAGAARRPVLSTIRGPALELVKSGKTGLLTEENNKEQLVDAVLKVLNDKDLEMKLGEQAYEHIVNNYTWEKVTDSTNKVYYEIL